MAKLVINTDVLQNTINTYNQAIVDIERAMKEADAAITSLKASGWKTNASRAFFNNFDNTWKTSMNNRVKVMKHLRDCLLDAKRDYDDICAKASRVGNSF